MAVALYRVKYRIDGIASRSYCSATVTLHSPSESEAISELKKRGTVGWDKTVIILDIQRA